MVAEVSAGVECGTIRRMKKLTVFVLFVLAAAAFTACSEHQTKTVERSASPLIGTWVRDGNTPKPDPKSPQFTRLAFSADGSLAAKYVAAGGALASVFEKAPKVLSETDTYTTTSSTLTIAEGSIHREYEYRVSGSKLYLTQAGGSEAAVFSKSNES
jgi:hypothetical protein